MDEEELNGFVDKEWRNGTKKEIEGKDKGMNGGNGMVE